MVGGHYNMRNCLKGLQHQKGQNHWSRDRHSSTHFKLDTAIFLKINTIPTSKSVAFRPVVVTLTHFQQVVISFSNLPHELNSHVVKSKECLTYQNQFIFYPHFFSNQETVVCDSFLNVFGTYYSLHNPILLLHKGSRL